MLYNFFSLSTDKIDKIARVIVLGEQSSLMFESILNKKSFKHWQQEPFILRTIRINSFTFFKKLHNFEAMR